MPQVTALGTVDAPVAGGVSHDAGSVESSPTSSGSESCGTPQVATPSTAAAPAVVRVPSVAGSVESSPMTTPKDVGVAEYNTETDEKETDMEATVEAPNATRKAT